MRHASRTQEAEIALSNQGTHGATELATTLRPPEVSVWSGDIDLHIPNVLVLRSMFMHTSILLLSEFCGARGRLH